MTKLVIIFLSTIILSGCTLLPGSRTESSPSSPPAGGSAQIQISPSDSDDQQLLKDLEENDSSSLDQDLNQLETIFSST